jgi:DNA-binding beta-propeller fold protein YncE
LVLLLSLAGGQASAADLQLVNEFGTEGTAPNQLTNNINDLQVAPDGDVVVTNAGSYRIQTYTPGGSFVRAFGSSGSAPGQFFNPSGTAIQNDGTIFVMDAGDGQVEVFDAAGSFVRQFPTPVDFYAGAAFNPAQTILYLVDYQAGNIQRVSTTGADMGLLGSFGTGPGQFVRPMGIAVDSSGNLYVADRDNNRVEKLSPSGEFLDTLGGAGSGPGQMQGPIDVAIEANGNVIVADTNNRRLEEFTPSGQFVASYERIPASPTPDFVPWQLATDPSGDIYIFDRQANAPRIVRVRPGPSAPVLGKTVKVGVVAGTIRIREKGTKKFHVLGANQTIPVGSSIDSTNGKVRLSAAKKGGGTQKAVFFDGRFSVHQSKRSTLTDLRLEGGNFRSCRGAARGGKGGSRVLRRLWGHGKGRTRTSGNNGSGTVRGTFWLTEDRCDGTFFKVRQGVVAVRDFTRHRTVVLHAGQDYLAPAR